MADIFDKMLDGINKGVNSVATGSKTMIEKAKINSAISTLEGEKRSITEQLGTSAYNLYKEGRLQNMEELGNLCEQIDQKIADIQVKQEEIRKLDEPAIQAQNTYQTPAADGGQAIYCSGCGNKNSITSKFCSRCGAKL